MFRLFSGGSRSQIEVANDAKSCVFGFLGSRSPMVARLSALCVTVEKPERFLRRLFQAACGNHQGKCGRRPPYSISSAAAVSTALPVLWTYYNRNTLLAEKGSRSRFPDRRRRGLNGGRSDCSRISGLFQWSATAPGHDEIRARGANRCTGQRWPRLLSA